MALWTAYVYVATAVRMVIDIHGCLVLFPDSSHGIDDRHILMEHWYVQLIIYVMKYRKKTQIFAPDKF